MAKQVFSGYQAFPITEMTYTGVATDLKVGGRSVLKFSEAGDVTLTYESGTTQTITGAEGLDITIDLDVVTVTSTAAILFS